MWKLITRSDPIDGATKMYDNRDDRSGLRYRYCVIVSRHSKMEMVVLLNGAIVSYNLP